ncbi:hypothetical protein BDU57DRAFT_450835 [Ampelomyces quisqualis]|uniref:Uncharacterized protein n=1 Tax=Ampelomyces quisqualis TaxID=50730 RepID=A0A6A5QJ93_AMPQU|nr:hypothetical protein BDU57DRAFT_450835 [Ampelomyces quisqualis]
MCTRGAILWLPPKTSIPSEHHPPADLVEEGCFNHPVLVLSVNAAETAVIVLIITSFGGTDLSIRHAHDTKARALHLPIYPSNAHPDNGMRLYLAGDQRLSKNSYIKIKPCRTIPTALLRPCKHGNFRLKTKSLQKLIKHMEFTDPWPKVGQVQQPVRAPQPVPKLPVAIHHPAREPISCASDYYMPGQWADDNRAVRASHIIPVHWVSPADRPARVYSGRERTPLLLPTYISGHEPKKDNSGSPWATFAWVIFIFTVVVGTAWYFKAFG